MSAAPRRHGAGDGISTALRWAGLLGIAVIATMRCTIFFADHLLFDVDPAVDPTPVAGMGPAGSMTLDALLLLACGAALLGEALAKRGVRWWMPALALLPAVAVFVHGRHDLDDLWRGATWVAATVAAVTVVHLARGRTMRVVLAALLLAVLGPLLVRGGMQVTVEHAETLREFERHREAFFADRGWAEDSAAARMYERRLRQPQPRGWFVTTNVWASLVLVGFVVSFGVLAASMRQHALRDRVGLAWLIVPALAAIMCGTGLAYTGSKGAWLAALAGAVLAALPWLGAHTRRLVAARGGVMVLALIALAVLGIVVRGTLLPESFAGERSVLFRWHYLVGAARLVTDRPLLGVGPGDFQTAYTAVRLPRSPEEVQSAHSVFADWLAMLGIFGVAWAALALMLLWRAGRDSGTAFKFDREDEPADEPRISRGTAAGVVAVVLIGFMVAMRAELATLDDAALLARVFGAVTYAAAALLGAVVLARMPQRVMHWSIASAVAALFVHAQIEMTLTQPGAVAWAAALVGLAAAPDDPPARTGGGAVRRLAAPAVLVLLAAALLVVGVRPARLHQDAAVRAAQIVGANEAPPLPDRRLAAAEVLVSAHEAAPIREHTLNAAAEQVLLAAEHLLRGASSVPPESAQRDERLRRAAALAERAAAIAEQATERFGSGRSISLAVAAHAAHWRATGEAPALDAAITHARRLTQIDPHGIAPWRGLGDLLWAADRRPDAAAAYERALTNSTNFELDPLKQLSRTVVQALRDRIASARETASTDAPSEDDAP